MLSGHAPAQVGDFDQATAALSALVRRFPTFILVTSVIAIDPLNHYDPYAVKHHAPGLALFEALLWRRNRSQQMLLLPVILFDHSNVRFPEKVDRWPRLVIVTPAVHRVHHSRLRMETDSNYSSVFSFWDQIAGTFRLRRDGRAVYFGLDEYDGEEWQRLSGLMLAPFPPRCSDSAIGVKNI
jgi:hypothetical protein